MYVDQRVSLILSEIKVVRGNVVAFWVLGIICALGLTVGLFKPDSFPVIFPMISICLVVGIFLLLINKGREGDLDFCDIGIYFVSIVAVYGLYPLATYLINDNSVSNSNDLRLFRASPTPMEMGLIGWYYAAYIAIFALFYYLFRSRDGYTHNKEIVQVDKRRTTLFMVVFLIVAVKGAYLTLFYYFEVKEADSYIGQYLIYTSLLPWQQQLMVRLEAVLVTLEIILMIVLFTNFTKYKIYIYLWFAFELTVMLTTLGQRTLVMMLGIICILSYHFFVKTIRPSRIVLFLSSMLLLNVIQGVWRNGSDLSIYDSVTEFSRHTSEFEALFANVFDLARHKELGDIGGLTSLDIYLRDLSRILPKQFLPFDVIDPAIWYVNSFYPDYAEAGGGFMFGSISEAVVGLGWTDIFLKGGMLGALYAFAHNIHVKRPKTIWNVISYFWLIVLSYNSFRHTTFSIIGQYLYNLFIPINIIKGLVRLGNYREKPA